MAVTSTATGLTAVFYRIKQKLDSTDSKTSEVFQNVFAQQLVQKKDIHRVLHGLLPSTSSYARALRCAFHAVLSFTKDNELCDFMFDAMAIQLQKQQTKDQAKPEPKKVKKTPSKDTSCIKQVCVNKPSVQHSAKEQQPKTQPIAVTKQPTPDQQVSLPHPRQTALGDPKSRDEIKLALDKSLATSGKLENQPYQLIENSALKRSHNQTATVKWHVAPANIKAEMVDRFNRKFSFCHEPGICQECIRLFKHTPLTKCVECRCSLSGIGIHLKPAQFHRFHGHPNIIIALPDLEQWYNPLAKTELKLDEPTPRKRKCTENVQWKPTGQQQQQPIGAAPPAPAAKPFFISKEGVPSPNHPIWRATVLNRGAIDILIAFADRHMSNWARFIPLHATPKVREFVAKRTSFEDSE